MPSLPTVSVAMATYNGAAHLDEQLQSLLAQTEHPVELVVADDGSTDDTEGVVKRFAARSPFPVRWHRNDRKLGYRANFMQAARLCRGDLIAFCDQDDVWHPRKLEIAIAAFRDPDVLLFHHEANIVRDGEIVASKMGKVARARGRIQSSPWRYPPGFAQVFRASLRDQDHLWHQSKDFKEPGELAAHDKWYYFLAACSGAIVFHAEPLADYRQHATNTVGVGDQRGGIGRRVRHVLENRAPMYRRLALAAEQYAALTENMRSGEHRTGNDLIVSAQAWRSLANSYTARAELYDGRLLTRFRAARSLARQGSYGSGGFWSFGRKAAIKDVVLGLALGPAVRRFGALSTGDDWSCRPGDGRAIQRAYARLGARNAESPPTPQGSRRADESVRQMEPTT